MKALKLFVVAALLSVACSASAQFVNARSGASSRSSSYVERPSGPREKAFINTDTDNYKRLNFSIVMSQPTLSGRISGTDFRSSEIDDMMFGVGIGYLYGINITGHNLPLFLELGPEFNYTFNVIEDTYYDEKTWLHFLSVGTPIDVAYRLRLSDNISLAPFGGLDVRVNAMALAVGDDYTASYFNSDDFEPTANRFQLGWNVGIGFYFGKFYLGYRFNSDIIPFMSDSEGRDNIEWTFKTNYVNLGIKF